MKENHAKMNDRKWKALNEAKVIFHNGSTALLQTRRRHLLAVLLDYLMHHCDAQACEENTKRVADDRRTVSSDGMVIPEHTWRSQVLAVCSFDMTGGGAVMNLSMVSC